MDVEALLTGLDVDQTAAVTERSSPLAIIAAAGSGKTTVLTRRIAYRVLTEPDVFAKHVLALTFTSQAARELERRLKELGTRERIVAGTFHATALRLLRERAMDHGHQHPRVTTDRIRLMQDGLSALQGGRRSGASSREDASLVLRDLDWCRARRIAPAESSKALSRAGRRSQIESSHFIEASASYARVKSKAGVMDFDDLLEKCLTELHNDVLWAEGVRWRYRHLFVDEAQDLNALQHAVLEGIRGGRSDVCLVGDPRQAIFGFNGADPDILNSVEEIYPGITIVRLQRNYRCTPQIVACAAAVLGAAGQNDDSRPVADDGPTVNIISHTDEQLEAIAVASYLRGVIGPSRSWQSCAVLARTVAQLTEIAHALAALGIPAIVQGGQGRSTALGATLAEAYAQRHPGPLADWVERITANPDSDEIRSRVADAADRFIAQRTGMSFRSWVDLHSPFDDLEALSSSPNEDGVDLLTFHAAKGREWRTVVVAGAEAGLIPHWSATTATQRSEEARLLYVACTRARVQLVLSWAVQRNGRPTGPSPLLARLAQAPDDDDVPTVAPRPQRLPKPDPVYTALVEWRRRAAKAAQVDPVTICSDESLRAVAQLRPLTVDAVAALTDLGPIAAQRIAPRLLTALNRAIADQSSTTQTELSSVQPS